MPYQILPLETKSIVYREIFRKDGMEIKCGLVWKLGSIITKYKPNFLDDYEPSQGICIADIKGANICDTLNGEKVIFFSDNVSEDIEEELTGIFFGISRKFSGIYQNIFQDLEWKLVSADSFIFGPLEVREIEKFNFFQS